MFFALAKLFLLDTLVCSIRDVQIEKIMPRIIEILLYKLKSGTGGEFFAIMQDVSVPLHRANGIDVVWHGQSMHDPDGYGLIRAFSGMASLEASLEAFYGSDTWRSGPREGIIARIETATRIVVSMNAEGIECLRKQGYYQHKYDG